MKEFDAVTQLVDYVPHLVQGIWMVVVFFLKYGQMSTLCDPDFKTFLTKKSKTDRPNISNIRHMCPQ